MTSGLGGVAEDYGDCKIAVKPTVSLEKIHVFPGNKNTVIMDPARVTSEDVIGKSVQGLRWLGRNVSSSTSRNGENPLIRAVYSPLDELTRDVELIT